MLMPEDACTYSRLSAQYVASLASQHYEFSAPLTCHFYVLGLHDNYLLACGAQKFILRIYRNDWRTEEDARFELDLLTFLGNQAAPVAAPLRTKSGKLLFSIDCPEGSRVAAVFHFADGEAPGNDLSAEQSTLLGRAIARIHLAADTFSTPYHRPILDLPLLFDHSLTAIGPFVEPHTRDYLGSLRNWLSSNLADLSRTPGIFGICIGDVNPNNFHINELHQLTVFDFDQCGLGFRAFEIGKFISAVHPLKSKDGIVTAFIDGYQQVRKLSQTEIAAIPYFEIVSVIWVMAINALNVDRTGLKFLDKPFWDRRVAIVKALVDTLKNSKCGASKAS